MRVVLDTNTVVSGFLWENSPRLIIDAAIDGRIQLFSSVALITEFSGVLRRRKFAKRLTDQRLSPALLLERYQTFVNTVEPGTVPRVVPHDPDDDHVLACAIAAQADLIVSGDRDLLDLKAYQGIPIVSAAEALKRLPQR